MEKTRFKIETWQLLFAIIASAFAVAILNSLSFGFTAERLYDSLIHTFFISLCVCGSILFLAPRIYSLTLLKRVVTLVIAIFVATFVGIVLTRLFSRMFHPFESNMLGLIPGRRTVTFSLIISYVFGFSTYFYLYLQNRLLQTKKLLRQKVLDEAGAKSLAVQSQLASLESRIHPHFLFNTLNSIAALIKENPDKAEKMVEKLSALLRYSLDFEPNKLVTLEEELKITKDYLEIESARFANKLEYSFDIKSEVSEEKLPAFSLQTLVENSIKHVAAKHSTKTNINIKAYTSDGILSIEINDSGDGFGEENVKGGHGIDTLKKRLQNLYAGNAALIIAKGAGGKVTLKIPTTNGG